MLDENSKGADASFRLKEEPKAQEAAGSAHIAKEYLPKMFTELGIESGAKVLDVGCGIGMMVATLREIGYDAYGLEPGGRFKEVAPDTKEFIENCYADEYVRSGKRDAFDVVMSFGVIEHVGTIDGHSLLAPEFLEYRIQFIEDSIKLLKPGGFLVVMGPNRLFPFDFQHGPHGYGSLSAIKRSLPFLKIIKRLTLPWHKENYLVSYDDLQTIGNGISSKSGMSGSYSYYHPKQGNLLGLTSLEGRRKLVAMYRLYVGLIDMLPISFRKVLHTHTLFVLKRS